MKKLAILLVCISSLLFTGCTDKFGPRLNDTESKTTINKEKVIEDEKKIKEDANKLSENYINKTEEIYNKAMDNLTKPVESSDESLTEMILTNFYEGYYVFRQVAPLVAIVSIFIGSVCAIFAKNNKGARRFFIIAFVIGIPLLCVFVVFGVGLLNDTYLEQN